MLPISGLWPVSWLLHDPLAHHHDSTLLDTIRRAIANPLIWIHNQQPSGSTAFVYRVRRFVIELRSTAIYRCCSVFHHELGNLNLRWCSIVSFRIPSVCSFGLQFDLECNFSSFSLLMIGDWSQSHRYCSFFRLHRLFRIVVSGFYFCLFGIVSWRWLLIGHDNC